MKRYTSWFAALLIITLVFGTLYAASQQLLRLDANDPQIQLAEDTAQRLNKGANPALLLGTDVTDASKSLSPIIAVYDTAGSLVVTNGSIAGQPPKVPIGVLRASKNRTYHFVTWQPNANTRLAAVSVKADKYYVLSARSLSEVENRENTIMKVVAAGWAGSVLVLFATYWLKYSYFKR